MLLVQDGKLAVVFGGLMGLVEVESPTSHLEETRMAFEPEKKYRITQKRIPLVDFVNPETKSLYILQPPYQRKPVWDDQQRQDLMG